MNISQLFPKHWSILHRDETVEEQRVERTVNKSFKLDGRMTRWIPYHFNKLWQIIMPKRLFWRQPDPKI